MMLIVETLLIAMWVVLIVSVVKIVYDKVFSCPRCRHVDLLLKDVVIKRK